MSIDPLNPLSSFVFSYWFLGLFHSYTFTQLFEYLFIIQSSMINLEERCPTTNRENKHFIYKSTYTSRLNFGGRGKVLWLLWDGTRCSFEQKSTGRQNNKSNRRIGHHNNHLQTSTINEHVNQSRAFAWMEQSREKNSKQACKHEIQIPNDGNHSVELKRSRLSYYPKD